MLTKFNINTTRDLLVPDFACYQMDLMGPVNAAINAGEVDEDFSNLPSWSKFAANPIKSKGFYTRTLQSMFLGQGGHDELNVDLQTEDYKSQRVGMMFMPANTRNDVLELIGNITRETLPGFEVIVLCGTVRHNGRKITNRNAERAVKEIVEQGRPTLIIAAQMAQRSFSIPEITELYLAYDKGENGATLQKMSRTLTPGDIGKVGRIFSLSFDPNRDDKFDAMIIETAQNLVKRGEAKSLREAMSNVLGTMDIWKCTPDGAIKISSDDYLKEALEVKRIGRVLGKIVNLNLLTPAEVTALATGNSQYFKTNRVGKAQTGKTRNTQANGGTPNHVNNNAQKEIAKAREVITSIYENLDIIILGTGSKIMVDAFDQLESDIGMQNAVEEEFGVPYSTIYGLFERNVISQDWVELLYDEA